MRNDGRRKQAHTSKQAQQAKHKAPAAQQEEEQVEVAHRFVRALLAEAGETVRILYGGSVKPGNAAELFSLENVDGGLIGGASLQAEDFLDIVRAAASTVDS